MASIEEVALVRRGTAEWNANGPSSEANLTGAALRDLELPGGNLVGVKAAAANLTRANLANADLRNAFLVRAVLISADLRDADLAGADLRDADLRAAKMVGANLLGARSNDGTQWPIGFAPTNPGVVVGPVVLPRGLPADVANRVGAEFEPAVAALNRAVHDEDLLPDPLDAEALRGHLGILKAWSRSAAANPTVLTTVVGDIVALLKEQLLDPTELDGVLSALGADEASAAEIGRHYSEAIEEVASLGGQAKTPAEAGETVDGVAEHVDAIEAEAKKAGLLYEGELTEIGDGDPDRLDQIMDSATTAIGANLVKGAAAVGLPVSTWLLVKLRLVDAFRAVLEMITTAV